MQRITKREWDYAALFHPGVGPEGKSEGCGQKEVLNESCSQFPGMDVPQPHASQVFQGVGPESLERLTGIECPIVQGIELDMGEVDF